MASERLLHCVGLTEDDNARLRLLLRSSSKHLQDGWSWGPEAKADVIIVDAKRLLGESAKRRAQQRDVPCAVVIEATDARPNDLYLRRPFQREAIVDLLNAVSDGNVTTVGPAMAWGEDGLDFDMGAIDLSALEDRYPGPQDAGAHRVDKAQVDAAALLAAAKLRIDLALLPSLQDPETASDKRPEGGAGAGAGPGKGAGAHVVARAAGAPATPAADEYETIDPKASYSFLDFFERKLLRVPSRLALPGTPVLSVDPGKQVYLTQGSLAAMEPYARRNWPHAAWEPLGPADAAAMERSSFTKPWVALIWMYHFIHSKGLLSRKFNPTGEFRLLQRFNVAVEYPLVHRIGAQLAGPRKLHEVARLSRVDIDLVYDVINAYDAVGYVEGTLRK